MNPPSNQNTKISVGNLIRRFWKTGLVTWTLVILEGLIFVVMPLAIGRAVDNMLAENFRGLIEFAVLCVLILLVGAGRRFYDTRAYAAIYRKLTNEMFIRENAKNSSTSQVSARTNLLREFIDFLEESIPSITHQVINVMGTLTIILFLDWRVFLACLVSVLIVGIIYKFSERKIFSMNKASNDEFESQVSILETRDRAKVNAHMKRLMRWQIKLSDLETSNFSAVWIVLSAVLLFTIWAVASSGENTFGQIISAVMYVFGFVETVMIFPLFYQQLVRLSEIGQRLNREND